MRRILLLVIVTVCAAACASDRGDETDAAGGVATGGVAQTYAPALNVDLARMTELEDGLYIEDLAPGSGDTVQAGQDVLVHYTGWLSTGAEFDSSRDPGEPPIEFMLGAGAVIDGWDRGLMGMRVGGRRRIVIPPEMAYGPEGAGSGVIPANATLVFDVELVDIRGSDPASADSTAAGTDIPEDS